MKLLIMQFSPSSCHLIPQKQTPWSESASELYRLRDRRFLAKLVPTFVERGCHVVSVTDPNGSILIFLDLIPLQSKYPSQQPVLKQPQSMFLPFNVNSIQTI
jgi:hypothetical protein